MRSMRETLARQALQVDDYQLLELEKDFLKSFKIFLNKICQTFIIGHYDPFVSHTTYVVCVNFIREWRYHFNVRMADF